MENQIRVTVTRPVQHDGVDYASGESLEMGPDMAAALIALGAALAAPEQQGAAVTPTDITPTPALPHEGGGGENEAAPEDEGPVQETPKAKAKKAAP